MKILITGAEGFVGKNLVHYLKKQYDVRAPSIKALDLRDSERVKKYLYSNKFDVIIHSATVLQKNKSYNNTVCEENLKMFFNLFEFKKKNTLLINLGSGSEFNRDNWIPKMKNSYLGKHIPSDGHSLSKYITAKFISQSNNKTLYHLRIFGIYGKYEDYLYKFISNTIVKMLLNQKIIINRDVKYHYLYVQDFCKIVEKIFLTKPPIRIFNVVPPKAITLTEITKLISKILNKPYPINILKDGYGKEYTGSNTEVNKIFNEFTSTEESIINLVKFYKRKIKVIKSNINKIKKDDFLSYAKKINK